MSIEFITDKKLNAINKKEFTYSLNGQKDLEGEVEQLRKTCDARDKYQRKRIKRRYYNLALMAKVDKNTTHEELKRLLKNNTRTFLIDTVTYKSNEVEAFIKLIRQAEKEHQSEEPKIKLVIGLALQITGDACQIGRIRNNCSLVFGRGDNLTLTTIMAYSYGSFKEIAFVINLQHYLPYIKLNDEISIGHEVRGCVIKKLKDGIVIRVEELGIVSSYDLVELPNQCDSLQLPALKDICYKNLKLAARLHVDFISVPHIRCLPFVQLLQQTIKTNYKFKLIGSIDLEYTSRKTLDLMGIIKHLDYLWLTNLFSSEKILNTILLQDVIPVAKSLKRSIIASVPLERCSDFKLFENHEILFKIDCIFIQKSAWCNKYPLIVRKLLPIKNFPLAIAENIAVANDILSNFQSMLNLIIRTIRSIECQAIFLHTKCEIAAVALSSAEIYCPVFAILSLDEPSQEIDCLIKLAKNLNLRRNIRTIPYTNEMNERAYKPIDYGIEYVRQCGCLETGDFIITLEMKKENGAEHVQLGVDDDMVLLRAIYIPPQSIGEESSANKEK